LIFLIDGTNRVLKGNKATAGDNGSVHVDEEERHRLHGSAKNKPLPLISGTAYCISSCSMIMLNKIVLSSYNFNAGISLMFYQVSFCCYFCFMRMINDG